MLSDILRNKKILAIGLSMSMLGSVAGCGASSAEMTQETTEHSVVASVDMNYEAPVQVPGILVDQVGYSTTSDKTAIFRGDDLSGSFDIYELESGRKVYTGEILKPIYNDKLGEYCSAGYFSDFREEGNYFLCTDVVGESFSFTISEDRFRQVFNDACKKYYINRCGIALSENLAGDNAHSACHTQAAHLQDDPTVEIEVNGGWHLDEQAGRDTALGSSIAENLLLAYEMNPTAFTDEVGIPESGNSVPDILDEVCYEVEWLLKMQDSRTGGEYGAAVIDTSKSSDIFAAPVLVTPVSMEATISFASMMARFSYIYQQFDAEFATVCLKAADRAYTCFLNNQKASDNTAAFKAAAQLYRATGDMAYHEVLEQYFGRNDFQELFSTDENVFLGSVTYLAINQQVDVDVCKILMKALMQRSEDIAGRAGKSGYLVTDLGMDDGFDKMLRDMRCLTITDHIIYNHEYTTIIENHAHYLMGMNPDAVNYISTDTERTYLSSGKSGILNSPKSTSLFIFMLSVLEK
jgi:endoglucanase